MDWTDETTMLGQIVSILLMLAGLAERAGSMPHAERCRVLGILRQAEIRALTGIAGSARCLGGPVPILDTAPDGDDPTDAAHLALRLRALALVWATLLTWLQRVARRQARQGVDLLQRPLARDAALASLIAGFALPSPRLDSS